MVASGGFGHGFKFASLIRNIVADVIERRSGNVMDYIAWLDNTSMQDLSLEVVQYLHSCGRRCFMMGNQLLVKLLFS